MNAVRNKYFLSNFVFLICLLVLVLNDHYLKYECSNWLTGKLSDVAGMIMLPMLIAFIFPRLKQHAACISGLVFIFWKSTFSQGLIELYNKVSFIETSRVVDFTDLFVLLVLPLPYLIIKKIDRLNFIKITNINPLFLVAPALLALLATSPPSYYYYTRSNGNLTCFGCNITVRYNQDEIVDMLAKRDIVFDSIIPTDSASFKSMPGLENERIRQYRINSLIIDKDTLKHADFTMRTVKDGKTKIYFNGLQVSDDISTFKLANKWRSYYKRLLFRELSNKLSN